MARGLSGAIVARGIRAARRQRDLRPLVRPHGPASGTSRCSAFSRACTTATASRVISRICRACSTIVRAAAGAYPETAEFAEFLRWPCGPPHSARRRFASAQSLWLRESLGSDARDDLMTARRAVRGDDLGRRPRLSACVPLTDTRPKPLLCVRGKPLIERHVEHLGPIRHRTAGHQPGMVGAR